MCCATRSLFTLGFFPGDYGIPLCTQWRRPIVSENGKRLRRHLFEWLDQRECLFISPSSAAPTNYHEFLFESHNMSRKGMQSERGVRHSGRRREAGKHEQPLSNRPPFPFAPFPVDSFPFLSSATRIMSFLHTLFSSFYQLFLFVRLLSPTVPRFSMSQKSLNNRRLSGCRFVLSAGSGGPGL